MVTTASLDARQADTKLNRGLVVAGIVLTALSLRPAVTSLGVLLDQVRAALGTSAATTGVLTALPVVCFAVFGAAAPALSRRIGQQQVVLASVLAIVVGLGGRAAATETLGFAAGSVLALSGIAVANVVLPAQVKRHFPQRLGLMMGLYSMSAAAGVALPAAITVPLAEATGYGWRGGLASWAAFAAIALVPWIALRCTTRPAPSSGEPDQACPHPPTALLRSSTALSLTAFFGLQSLNAYVMMGWLPAILTSAGLTTHNAALMLSASAVIAIPISLALPRIAARKDGNQRWCVVLVVAGGIAGYLGLLLAPALAPLLWVMFLAALHGAFPLAVTLIALRSRDPATTTQLSSFVQSGGYLLAALGPLTLGALHELTTTWTIPLTALIATLVLELVAGLAAARPRHVETELSPVRLGSTPAQQEPRPRSEA